MFHLVDGLIMFFGGLYVTLLAHRVVGNRPGDPKWEAWHRTWGRHVKVLGPLLMIGAVVLLLMSNR